MAMESVSGLFLQALRASLENRTVDWETELTQDEWKELFAMAASHNVLPLIYSSTVHCPAAQKADSQIFSPYKQQTLQAVVLQTVKTSEFLKLLPALESAGVTPVVVKGLICRELYPNPDYRMSADEDVFIPPEQFERCHKAMCSCAMELLDPKQDMADYEIPYGKKGSPLRIELHKHLFPPESEATGELNRFFDGVHERAITRTVQGVAIPAMGDTDHLFYLICHAFKHFLHSGVGIRQVCDICLYANAYGANIDWQLLFRQCREIHGELFARALFQIGQKYLTFDPEKACFPEIWRAAAVDETAILEDLLDSGVFGASSMSRKHSSNITLNAVSAEKQGRKGGSGVLKTVFPPARMLSGRYPYLKEKPFLLPFAWASRILSYGKETAAGSADNSAAQSIKIGSGRVELLKKYGIIGSDTK